MNYAGTGPPTRGNANPVLSMHISAIRGQTGIEAKPRIALMDTDGRKATPEIRVAASSGLTRGRKLLTLDRFPPGRGCGERLPSGRQAPVRAIWFIDRQKIDRNPTGSPFDLWVVTSDRN